MHQSWFPSFANGNPMYTYPSAPASVSSPYFPDASPLSSPRHPDPAPPYFHDAPFSSHAYPSYRPQDSASFRPYDFQDLHPATPWAPSNTPAWPADGMPVANGYFSYPSYPSHDPPSSRHPSPYPSNQRLGRDDPHHRHPHFPHHFPHVPFFHHGTHSTTHSAHHRPDFSDAALLGLPLKHQLEVLANAKAAKDHEKGQEGEKAPVDPVDKLLADGIKGLLERVNEHMELQRLHPSIMVTFENMSYTARTIEGSEPQAIATWGNRILHLFTFWRKHKSVDRQVLGLALGAVRRDRALALVCASRDSATAYPPPLPSPPEHGLVAFVRRCGATWTPVRHCRRVLSCP